MFSERSITNTLQISDLAFGGPHAGSVACCADTRSFFTYRKLLYLSWTPEHSLIAATMKGKISMCLEHEKRKAQGR